jgi:peptide/nickel transport system substrate-binding protein
MSLLNTRRALRWVGVLMILSLLLSACAPAAAPASAPAAGGDAAAAPGDELTRANTLVFAADMTDIITLDPAVVYEFGGILPAGNIYETLVSFNPGEPELVPLLAESWEITEAGDMWSMTFTLNPNAKFASGNPVTAEDCRLLVEPRDRHQQVAGVPAHRSLPA